MAALAGVDLAVAKRGLVNLANLVGGDLEVSKDGKRLSPLPPALVSSLIIDLVTEVGMDGETFLKSSALASCY